MHTKIRFSELINRFIVFGIGFILCLYTCIKILINPDFGIPDLRATVKREVHDLTKSMGIQNRSSGVGHERVALLDNKVLDSIPLELDRAVPERSTTVTIMI